MCVIMDMNYQSVRNLVCRSLNRLRELAMAVWSRCIVRPVISFLQPHLSSFYTASPVQPIPAQSTFRRGVIQYTIEWHSVYGFTRKSMWFHSMLKAISSTIKQWRKTEILSSLNTICLYPFTREGYRSNDMGDDKVTTNVCHHLKCFLFWGSLPHNLFIIWCFCQQSPVSPYLAEISPH